MRPQYEKSPRLYSYVTHRAAYFAICARTRMTPVEIQELCDQHTAEAERQGGWLAINFTAARVPLPAVFGVPAGWRHIEEPKRV